MHQTDRVALLFCISAAVLGCRREPPAPQAPAAATETPSAEVQETTAPAAPAGAVESDGALTIEVLREDSRDGVAADVERIVAGQASWFADVSDSGVYVAAEPCKAGERFQVTPKVPAFLKARPQPCAGTITFRLYGTQATLALISAGDDAMKSGDLVRAQAHYQLAAERLEYADPQRAQQLNVLATAAAGRVLGVEQPTTRVQGDNAISTQTIDSIKEFQRAVGVAQTGELDSATSTRIAETSSSKLLEEAVRGQVSGEPRDEVGVDASQVASIELSQDAQMRSEAIRKRLEQRQRL